MLKKTFGIVIFMLALAAIQFVACSGAVRGSGDVIEEKREVQNFDRVKLDGFGEIILTQGDEESVIIEAEDNLMEYIKTSVRGDQLIIDIRHRGPLIPTKPMRFYVTTPNIEGVSVDGVGSVTANEIQAKSIEFDVDGAGNIMIDALEAERVSISIDGIGNIGLEGSVDEQQVSINGAGNYDGEKLSTEKAEVKIDGVGDASVAVEIMLVVDIDGAGNVIYSGNPSLEKTIDGIGRISKQ